MLKEKQPPKDTFDLTSELFADALTEDEENANNSQEMDEGVPSNKPSAEEAYDSEATTNQEEDMFIVTETLRKPKLAEGNYPALIGKLQAKKMSGDSGNWIAITLPFNIRHPKTGETVTVNFISSKSLKPKSRLYPIVRGILGAEPGEQFDLRCLQGKKVFVQIEHRTVDSGDIWENVTSVKPRSL